MKGTNKPSMRYDTPECMFVPHLVIQIWMHAHPSDLIRVPFHLKNKFSRQCAVYSYSFGITDDHQLSTVGEGIGSPSKLTTPYPRQNHSIILLLM